jgi:hypothetical protein
MRKGVSPTVMRGAAAGREQGTAGLLDAIGALFGAAVSKGTV